MLSEHAYCPENYVRQVFDARDELPDSEEAFNTSQMNTNQRNMFATDAAAADSFELDINGHNKKKKKKEFENTIEFIDKLYKQNPEKNWVLWNQTSIALLKQS